MAQVSIEEREAREQVEKYEQMRREERENKGTFFLPGWRGGSHRSRS